MQKPETGYLLIADITGYTRFLKDSELEHARGILEQLFSALLAKLRSPFALSNIQGDAILAHARAGHVSDGRHVLDMVESLYCGFADALETMLHNTTCTCAACSNIAKLDLKLFVHFGSYVEQSIAGRQELGGPDVILIHRLLKNSISSATGIRAYAAFTEAAASATGLAEYFGHAVRHQEKDETFGEIPLRVLDMRPVWEAHRERSVIVIGEHDARVCEDVSADLAIPPDRVWYYLTDPNMRGAWVPNVTSFTRIGADRGRATVGTVDHCAHGDGTKLVFTVIDWRPHDHITYHLQLPMGGALPYTIFIAPTAEGCRVTVRVGLPIASNKLAQAFLRFQSKKIGAMSHGVWTASLAKLAELAKADAAAGRAAQVPPALTPHTLKTAVDSRLAPA
jgi:uncharacterized protein YndB with AHSA1/START domain